jgi:DNA polymerase III alpha subunit
MHFSALRETIRTDKNSLHRTDGYHSLMPDKDFVHLHLHTDYSLLDGAIQVGPLAKHLNANGMKACAITDHGNIYGAISFYKEMKGAGIKPIIGMEAYFSRTTRQDRTPVPPGERAYNHLILLAKDREGYHNLVRLTSKSFTEGFYRKPRIDWDLLSQYSKGLVCLSACLSGLPQYHLGRDRVKEAAEAATRFQDIFGKGNYFLELQDHKLDGQKKIEEGMFELSKKTGIPLVATNDAHYLTREDCEAHDVMLCISQGKTISETNRLKFGPPEWYVRSPEEMWRLFEKTPELLTRTTEIAEMCNLDLKFGENQLPIFPIPPKEGDITVDEYFEKVVRRGFEKRKQTVYEPLKAAGKLRYPYEEYEQRLAREIGIIKQMGFPSYFLIVWDFIKYARDHNIPVGPGRGCLEGRVPIVMADGATKPISQVKVGDLVRSHTGRALPVTAFHRYEADETLVRLKCYYGDSAGVTLTKDHKVWAERGVRPDVWQKARAASTRAAKQQWAEPTGNLEWVQAGELKAGDWVFVPTPQIAEAAPQTIDLADTADDSWAEVSDSFIEEKRPVNISFPYSLRDVHRQTGVSRNSLHFIVSDATPRKANPRHDRAVTAVAGYISPQFGSVATWGERVAAQTQVTTRTARFIPQDRRFFRLLGRWVADGWLRSDSDIVWGICFNSDDEEGLAETVEFFHSIGLTPHVRQAVNGRKLTQLVVRSRALAAYWRSIFPAYQARPETKHLPEFVLRLPTECVLDVLAGYWAGDGSVSRNYRWGKFTATTVSRALADQIRFLAWRCGIPASLQTAVRTDPRFALQTSYIVNIAKDERLATRLQAEGQVAQYVWRQAPGGLLLRLREIEEVTGVTEVFDLTVAEEHTYQTSSFAVHNSAAGSLVSYCLEVTDVDPVQYDLLFERFLNPERVSMPDIDVDFCIHGRQEVIRHVTELYGRDSVCQIITFGTMAAKAAVKDVGRALEMPYAEVEKIAKLLPPPVRGRNVPIATALEQVAELRQMRDNNPQVARILEIAQRLEGCARHSSVHAAGVVISPKPLEELVPIAVSPRNDELTTQYEMFDLEKTGMLKMDFLGLTTLTIINEALKSIKEATGEEIDWGQVSLEDEKTYQLFANGNLGGIFQFEGCLSGDTQIGGTGRTIKKLYEESVKLKAQGKFNRDKQRAGFRLKSCYVDEGKFHLNDVLDVVSSGVKPVYRIVAEGNYTIKATSEHRFLTQRGWVELGDLDPATDALLFNTANGRGRRVCADCGAPLKSMALKVLRCKACAARITSNPSKPSARAKISRANTGKIPWNYQIDESHPLYAEWIDKLYHGQDKVRGKTLEEIYGPERAAAIRAKASARFSGQGNPMYGRSPEGPTPYSAYGFRADLGHLVRSSWEADFARVLNYLQIAYQYEPQRFTLQREDGSTLTYTPDFYVPQEQRWYEIKGWMDTVSAEKIALFRQQYPQETLVVIDRTRFAELQMKYRNLVQWECPKTPPTTVFLKIKSIKYEGKEETYDIKMKPPGNNFLANGFVVHNSGIAEICMRLQPKELEDLSALNALYRPGPLDSGMVEDYIERHHGRKPVQYIVPEMEEYLKSTKGILVYQEQIQQLAQKLAGYSLGEADLMRRAMGKKNRDEMAVHQDKFVKGAVANKIPKKKAEEIFKLMANFADYGFNRSHSVCYAYVAFQTAYLKAHYPSHFYASVLTNEVDNSDKVLRYSAEARAQGMKILPPDINESKSGFTAIGADAIRYGLTAIKGLGHSAVEALLEARGGEPFKSLFDFAGRVPAKALNKRVMEGLVAAGAFDSLKPQPDTPPHEWRARLHATIDRAIEHGAREQRDSLSGQFGLFGAVENDAPEPELSAAKAWHHRELLTKERESVGFYISGHPLEEHANTLKSLGLTPISKLSELPPNAKVKVGGLVSEFMQRTTKKGAFYSWFRLEDMENNGGVKCVLWPESHSKFSSLCQNDALVYLVGRIDSTGEGIPSVIIDEVHPLAGAGAKGARAVVITLSDKALRENEDLSIEKLQALLTQASGVCPVFFDLALQDENLTARLSVSPEHWITPGSKIEDALANMGCEVKWLTSLPTDRSAANSR